MILELFDINGVSKNTYIRDFTHYDEHMGVGNVSCKVYVSDLDIGDYVIINKLKYSLIEPPTKNKVSDPKKGNYDAVYYDAKFHPPERILKNIIFEDWVTSDDSDRYYTGGTDVMFFNNVTELADRIKANLDRFPGHKDKWNVSVSSYAALEEKQISTSGINLWDALMLCYSEFGLDFYIQGYDIKIGGPPYEISTTFEYGKENGLYSIKRTPVAVTELITRLKCYGSTRNIPSDYLRDEVSNGRYFTRVMLPYFPSTGKDYIDADYDVINKYGIIEGVKIFEDIYPSIEGINLGNGRIDEIVSVSDIDENSDYFTVQVRDLGFDMSTGDFWSGDTPKISIKGTNADGSIPALGGYEFDIDKTSVFKNDSGYSIRLLKNKAENNILPNSTLNVKAGDRFVILGIFMPDVYVQQAESRLYDAGRNYFESKNDAYNSYSVDVDNKYIIDNNLSYQMLAGRACNIKDADLQVDSAILVQKMTTKYGGVIPTYKMEVSNVKKETLKEAINTGSIKQSGINNVVNTTINTNVSNNNTTNNTIGESVEWDSL